MVFGRSIIPVFGAWVAWVYLLSLLVLLGLREPEAAAPLRPQARFVDADTPFQCLPGCDGNSLSGLAIEISEPLDHDIAIPVKAIPATARPAEHYDADIDAAAVVKAGQTHGVIREREGLLDITIRSAGIGPKPMRFMLEMQHTRDIVAAPDPQGRREVELQPDNALPPPPNRLTPAGFDELFTTLVERELPEHRFVVRAERPVDKDADVLFELQRGIGDDAVPLTSFKTSIPRGAAETSFCLVDKLSASELQRLGLADDDVPGTDEFYELHVDPRPPLIARSDPCFLSLLVVDDDGGVEISQILEDQQGARLARVMPNEPFYVVPELSRPLERECHVVPMINGTTPAPLLVNGTSVPFGIIPAGRTRGSRFGPFTEKGDRDVVPVSVHGEADQGGLHRCAKCNGEEGGCDVCRPKTACKSCGDAPGGCDACRGPHGKCRGCCGRPGGCLACGFGSGTCGRCKGAAGPCSACGGGSGGGGSGGGQNLLVRAKPPRDIHVGPPVQGDFLLLLVNNQRLHEPGDAISQQVAEAIKNEKPYQQAAIVVNEVDETPLKGSRPPDPATTFRPFSRDEEGLSGQVRRIVDTIAEKRGNAATDRLPTVVIWPERELSSAADLEPLAALAADGGGPIAILCPDADPEKARRIATALTPPNTAKGRITVRSPKTPELADHIRDVIHSGVNRPASTTQEPQ